MKKKYPKITIITPSYNSCKYIEKTINSVLNQNYPNLEYLIFDGGSTDGTIDIVKKYKNNLKWVSENDKGQSDAINKGLLSASGEILSWINSNDIYLPGAFNFVVQYFIDNPDIGFVFGKAKFISEDDNFLVDYNDGGSIKDYLEMNEQFNGHFYKLLNENCGWIPQQSAFWRKKIIEDVGLINTELHYAMDYEYWLRIGLVCKINFINEYIGGFRIHDNSKTNNARKQWAEILKINYKYGGKLFSPIHKRFLKLGINSLIKKINNY